MKSEHIWISENDFKLYGLNRKEVEIVLDSLDALENIKNDIIKNLMD